MIVEGGRFKCNWGWQLIKLFFEWLIAGANRLLIGLMLMFVVHLSAAQNCDVDFPGISNLNFSSTCGGLTNSLNLGKSIFMGDNDIFTFDSPSLINIQGNFTVSAAGDGKIVIPAGVTVIIDGNVQLDAKNGDCDHDSPCTFTIVVNGSLQVSGSLQNNLVNLVWEGSGTVPVTDRLENSSNGCMSCGATCPQFPDGPGGCVDSGNGCSVDFCSTIYGTDCQIDSIDPVIMGCPTDMTLSTENSSCNAVVSWTEPTASDNCGISSFTSTHNPGDTFPLGTTTVTYTAIDNNGQTASCSFRVEVVDNVGPLITGCPGDITTSEIDPVDNVATISWMEPVASDNCTITSFTSTHQPGMKFPEGQTVVTYTALDNAGNQQTCSFIVIVNQNGSTIEEELKVYKAFSPNGDGINDLWSIGGIEQYPENSVNIFDRWGSIVYQASGYNNEQVVWDGTGNSNRTPTGRALPAGTYFYSIKIPQGGSLSGYVELVK